MRILALCAGWIAAGLFVTAPIPAVAGNSDLEEVLALVKEAESLAKDAGYKTELQNIREATRSALASAEGSPEAAKNATWARDALRRLVKDPRKEPKRVRALVVKAFTRAETYLVGPPPGNKADVPPVKRDVAPPVDSGKGKVVPGPIVGHGKDVFPGSGGTDLGRAPPPDAPVVDQLSVAAYPQNHTGPCDGRLVQVTLNGSIHTTGNFGWVTVRYHSDAGDWDSRDFSVECTRRGWWTVPSTTLTRSDSWSEQVRLVLVRPTTGPVQHSDDMLVTGRCGDEHPEVARLPEPLRQDRTTAVMTPFVPSIHGFHFNNTFENNLGFEVRTRGLCGGMVYAALDYYYARQRIPSQDYRPQTGSVLQGYIFGRQATSITLNILQFGQMTVAAWDVAGSFAWGLSRNGGLGSIRYEIDQGRPVPINLRSYPGGPSTDHQILAIGYDLGRYVPDRPEHRGDLRIFVYDPNHRNLVRVLKPDLTRGCFSYEHIPGYEDPPGMPVPALDEQWVTYFVDQMYVRDPYMPTVREPDLGPRDNLIRELLVTFRTGGRHMGGGGNVHLRVNLRGRPPATFENVNLSQVWVIQNDETVSLTLPTPVPLQDVESIGFRKSAGDPWDVEWVALRARGGGIDRTGAIQEPAPYAVGGNDFRTFTLTPTW